LALGFNNDCLAQSWLLDGGDIVGFGKLQSRALLSRTIASIKNVLPSCEVYRSKSNSSFRAK
jgi:hypothetical protein